MSGDRKENLARRTFLGGMTAAAGTVQFAPRLLSAAPLVVAAEEAKAASATETGQTKRLAEYAVALRYEDIPAPVLQRAKDCIADTVGVILFGAQFPWSQMIVAYARRNGAPGKSVIFGTDAKVQAASAALAHGALTHAFEQDNLTDPDSGAHPGASLFCPGLAVAQERGSTGRDLLTAFVAGAEVVIRVGLATKRTNEARGFHAPGTVGPFGATIVAGRLLRLDAAKMTNALGLAGSLSGGLLEFASVGNGAMVKRLHMGRAAEAGVLAANLASEGFTGPTTVLEGKSGFLRAFCNAPDFTELTKGLGQNFASRTILLKRFACHITAHTPVSALLELRDKYKFAAADVVAINIAGSKRMATANNLPAPPDILIGQFSIPFCVALTLYRNPVDPYVFTDAAVHDPEIRAAMARVTMTVVNGQSDDDVSSALTVKLKDGRTLVQRATDFRGAPSNPLDRNELREKFLLLTQKHLKPDMERLFDRLQNLDSEKNFDWLSV